MSAVDGRLARGAQTRQAILRRAVEIASVEGLDGLSIGRLSTELEVSKSGVFAHFGSKEELQLATLRYAGDVFAASVIDPAMDRPPGLGRLRAVFDHWLDYSRQRVFPGGCFFQQVASEFDAREGRVRDEIVRASQTWTGFLNRVATDAVQLGELAAGTDVAQLTFELFAMLRAADADAVLLRDEAVYQRARAGIDARLDAARAGAGSLPS